MFTFTLQTVYQLEVHTKNGDDSVHEVLGCAVIQGLLK
jgi:hypothetical protein